MARRRSACRSCRLAGWQFVPPDREPPVNCMADASIVESSSSVADLGGCRGAAAPPLASFRKIQGLPISKIVRTADSRQIIIITNFTLQLAPTKFFKGRRERGHEGAWGTPKAPAAAPPCKNPGSATGRRVHLYAQSRIASGSWRTQTAWRACVQWLRVIDGASVHICSASVSIKS